MADAQTSDHERPPFTIGGHLSPRIGRLRRPLVWAVDRVLGLAELSRRYRHLPATRDVPEFVRAALRELGVRTAFDAEDLARIPATGPCIVVANHPHGGVDGLALMDLLLRVRPDVRFVANHFLAGFHELRSLLLQVDPFGGGRAARFNIGAVRAARRWLDQGGMIVMFPGGEVSSLNLQTRRITDPEWTAGVARLARQSGAPVLPVFIDGHNSALFQLGGLLHPRLRTMLLVREMLKFRAHTLGLRIGRRIAANVLKEIDDDDVAAQYLQYRTYLLRVAQHDKRRGATSIAFHEPLAPPVATAKLVAEVAALPRERLLTSHGALEVWYFVGNEAPSLLAEIGRLRELSFRGIGEGTGRPCDLDEYDDYYHHMFMWDREAQQVLGGYRMGPTTEIVAARGARGLYTHSLFRLSERLVDKLQDGVEMGRSFIRPEQQRSYTSLLMLWRGIGAYVVRNPRYRYLYGPVSISNDYHPLSKQILVAMLKRHKFDAEYASDVRPRKPFRLRESDLPLDAIDDTDSRVLADLLGTIEEDEKGVPVLLRQYLKLGGRILGFNIDPAFSNVIDGMLVVDLLKSEPGILAKYLTEEGVELLHAHHGHTLRTSSAA
ncbi:MAG: lysophospholipid acyltransferase family protein [Gammaproteobacteria bacterium]